MHGTLNGTFGVSIMMLQGGSDLSVGLTGVSGLAVLAAADVLLWLASLRAPRLLLPRGDELVAT